MGHVGGVVQALLKCNAGVHKALLDHAIASLSIARRPGQVEVVLLAHQTNVDTAKAGASGAPLIVAGGAGDVEVARAFHARKIDGKSAEGGRPDPTLRPSAPGLCGGAAPPARPYRADVHRVALGSLPMDWALGSEYQEAHRPQGEGGPCMHAPHGAQTRPGSGRARGSQVPYAWWRHLRGGLYVYGRLRTGPR